MTVHGHHVALALAALALGGLAGAEAQRRLAEREAPKAGGDISEISAQLDELRVGSQRTQNELARIAGGLRRVQDEQRPVQAAEPTEPAAGADTDEAAVPTPSAEEIAAGDELVTLVERATARTRWTDQDSAELRRLKSHADPETRAQVMLSLSRAINEQRLALATSGPPF